MARRSSERGTDEAVVKRAAYMLVYEKSGPKGQIEWHRGYEIRLKHQILNRYLILGIFFFTKISTLHRTTSRSPKTFAPHLQQLLGKTAVAATGPAAAAKHLYQK